MISENIGRCVTRQVSRQTVKKNHIAKYHHMDIFFFNEILEIKYGYFFKETLESSVGKIAFIYQHKSKRGTNKKHLESNQIKAAALKLINSLSLTC